MTFTQYAHSVGSVKDYFTEIGMHKALTIKNDVLCVDGSKLKYLSKQAEAILWTESRRPFLDVLDFYITCEVLGNGPKIFRPTSEQLRMLEEMNLNIDCDDFAMPFDTIVVEFPEDYCNTKIVENPIAGAVISGHVQQDTHKPSFSILHRHCDYFIHSVVMDGTALKSYCNFRDEKCIERWFDAEISLKDSLLPANSSETELESSIRRAVLNYCLLLDEVGIKQTGNATPNEYSQLVKYLSKKPNKHTPKNRIQFASQSKIFDLKQSVKLYRTVSDSADHQESTGKTLKPHNRRGHYKMQRFGPGLSEKKRIRIPPTLVNAHLLVGNKITTTYLS